MKANELMIGDWVKVTDDDTDDSFIGQVKAIDELENINVPEGEDVAYPYSIDCLEPIPITTEILEKNGFDGVYSSNYKIFKEEVYSTLYISLWKGRLSIYKTPDIRQRHAATRLSMNCKYVHELQHALRLCGIEKEITI